MAVSGLTLAILLLIKSTVSSASTGCKDNNGEAVDWFVMYKLPRLSSSSDPLIKQGLGYYYMDVNSQHWSLGKESLNGTKQAVYYTLQQVYDSVASQDMMYIFYNDETPVKKVSYTKGHTKGDLAFDKTSGFWLVHSVPRFPPYSNDVYSYPESGTHYGQTFLCVTYQTNQLEAIGQQLLYTYPQIYNYSLPAAFAASFPNISEVVKGKHIAKTDRQYNSVKLTSTAGQDFTSFAKFTDFNADLYDSWVAPTLGSSLYVETWQNGAYSNKMPTNCSTDFWVYNIDTLKVSETEFKETQDHSKWAVTVSGGKQYICIGDINREISQKLRAGGTVCAQLTKVWQAFNSSVTSWEPCPQQSRVVVLGPSVSFSVV